MEMLLLAGGDYNESVVSKIHKVSSNWFEVNSEFKTVRPNVRECRYSHVVFVLKELVEYDS